MTTPINPPKLLNQLKTAGLPVTTVRSAPNPDQALPLVEYERDLTPQERTAAQTIIDAHDPIDYYILPSRAFLKGNDTHTTNITILAVSPPHLLNTHPHPTQLTILINDEPLTLNLTEGRANLALTSDTPGAAITITGQSGELATQQTTIYVI